MPEQGFLEKRVPGLTLLLHYDRTQLAGDLQAALVVAVVLIPAAFAAAELTGCPPAAGIYASIAGMVAYALFASSRHVNVGPDTAIALLVGSAIEPYALGDPSKAAMLATILAFLTAVVLIFMARLRLGIAADFLSSPALLGFMNGAAVVIIGSKIGRLCGISLKQDNTLLRFWEWGSKIGNTHVPTLLVGMTCLTILALCGWKLRRVPGAVVLFAMAMILGRWNDFSDYGMQIIGKVDLNLTVPTRSGLAISEAGPLFMAAIGIALLAFSKGIMLGRSVASKHGYAINPDRELFALGMANIAAGAVFSFAVGSSQTRTLLNDTNGGRSQMVSFLAAVIVIVVTVLFANWLAAVPSVVIAAILIYTGVTLIDVELYRRLWRLHRFSAAVAAATTLGVVAIGVLPGILLGVILSLLGVLAEIVRPQDALLGCVAGSSTLHDIGDDKTAMTIPGLVVYRFYGPLIFANVRYFIERIEGFISQEKAPVREVIIDARAIPNIDITATEQLCEYAAKLHDRDIEFIISTAHLPLRETIGCLGGILANSLRFSHIGEALADYRNGEPQLDDMAIATPGSSVSTAIEQSSE